MIETEYLGFNISRQEVKLQEKKIEELMKIETPTIVRQVYSFLGSINHYEHMIHHHPHVNTDLTALTKKVAKFMWTFNCLASFDNLKL